MQRSWAGGDALLPLPAAAPDEVVAGILAALRPAVLRGDDGDVSLPDPVPVAADTALVVTTSGTTGPPKGVELTHQALTAAVGASLDRLESAPGDRWLCCLPLHHVAGILVLLRAWQAGTEPIVHAGFDPAEVGSADAATHIALVPTMLHRLLDARVDVGRFRRVLVGGAKPGRRLRERAGGAGAPVTVSYGMTETCGGCVYDGVPLDGVEVRVDADGCIAIRGPVVMRRYRGRPDLTAAVLDADGWLRTADLGRWTDDGRLEVLGRGDDVIVTGGEKVAAGQLAALLCAHPRVADAAVVGRADLEWGERVVAYCVAADPLDPPTLEELRDFVAAQAPRHAPPRELRLVDDLP
ncbi:MAG: AMP-binding protein [Actinobacteria bacterium]|nr:AMP-binding protein [Actinomycetota bacterium]